MTTKNKFAERLVYLRKEHNLSQSDLAKELKISAACINRWEKALRVPSIESIMAIALYFHCTSDFLIGITDYC